MKIDRVQVTYGELRSTGFPDFSNRRVEVTLGAVLEESDTAEAAKERLYQAARQAVKEKFGDPDAAQTEMNIPYKP